MHVCRSRTGSKNQGDKADEEQFFHGDGVYFIRYHQNAGDILGHMPIKTYSRPAPAPDFVCHETEQLLRPG